MDNQQDKQGERRLCCLIQFLSKAPENGHIVLSGYREGKATRHDTMLSSSVQTNEGKYGYVHHIPYLS